MRQPEKSQKITKEEQYVRISGLHCSVPGCSGVQRGLESNRRDSNGHWASGGGGMLQEVFLFARVGQRSAKRVLCLWL